MRYLIIIEPTDTGFSAYSPDLQGCVSTEATRQEVERNMREAIEFHVEGLQVEGLPVPEPSSESTTSKLRRRARTSPRANMVGSRVLAVDLEAITMMKNRHVGGVLHAKRLDAPVGAGRMARTPSEPGGVADRSPRQ